MKKNEWILNTAKQLAYWYKGALGYDMVNMMVRHLLPDEIAKMHEQGAPAGDIHLAEALNRLLEQGMNCGFNLDFVADYGLSDYTMDMEYLLDKAFRIAEEERKVARAQVDVFWEAHRNDMDIDCWEDFLASTQRLTEATQTAQAVEALVNTTFAKEQIQLF